MIDDYINQYGRRLFGLCVTLCGNYAEAEDLYQDTWLKVVEHIGKYDTERDFEPWLTRICVNTYRNMFRRLARSPVESELDINSIPLPMPEDYGEVREAISRLPEKLRLTVILFYFKDMDIKSVAQVLKIPEGTVKSRLNKAKKILKEVLKDEADISI